ncbi:esterase/lipase family protein [Paludisphaera soli]|uniref:esterase/lipase family protein n=1 Tax=Paludisphaera soli TaxID=2712865 RepID=UPI0013E9FF44|nr:hypothetical protein [Paludisphaera soli]
MNGKAGTARLRASTPGPPAGRRLLLAAAAAALLACGCRAVAPVAAIATVSPSSSAPARASLIPGAREARREGARLERRGVDASVDRYYEATVRAAAALNTATATNPHGGDLDAIRELYNESLGDCLRAAQRFGRIDAKSALVVNGPAGSATVPIRHVGFIWKADDFGRLVHPCEVPRNPSAHAPTDFPGLGAGVAVERPNPRMERQDEFLPRTAVFNATAVLRPDLDAWLGDGPARPPSDVLELYDPLRTPTVSFGPSPALPLHADLGLAIARARQIQEARGPYALAGFAMPERMLAQADIRMLEPYQPGKAPILLVHGLLDDPFLFNDMLIALQRTPGFLDRHQLWVFRYPTGVTFIRSASILRKQVEKISATLDPAAVDPAMSGWTLVGYSMGGLLCRLQVSWSGDAVWDEVATRPLEQLKMSDASRRTVRDLFFFEPSPRIRRVIFIATPHDGASPTIAAASWLATRIVQRPADTRQLVEEVDRANPGVLRPSVRNLPSSVDALAAYSPLLPAIRKLPYNPAVRLHTIAGTGVHAADRGRGDLVVPLSSAHVDEAESEHHVRATHSNIYYQRDTIDEVRRILGFAAP